MSVLGLRRFKETIECVVIDPPIGSYDNVSYDKYGFTIEPLTILDVEINGLSIGLEYTYDGENTQILCAYLDKEFGGALPLTTVLPEITTFNIISTANSTVDEWLLANTIAAGETEDTIYTEKSSWYKSVADAIRNKKGTTDPILRDDFESEISSITGGELYEVMDASELPEDAPNGSLALVEGEPIPQSYTVSSVDELPSNAVDGSMAIVENVYSKMWILNDELTSFADMDKHTMVFETAYDDTLYTGIQYATAGPPVYAIKYLTSLSGSVAYAFESNYGFTKGWVNENYKVVYVYFADETAMAWLNENGIQDSEWNFRAFLFTRENGEWVYKCEVV